MMGAYTWSKISVKENVGLSTGGLYAGRGGYRRRNTVVISLCQHERKRCCEAFQLPKNLFFPIEMSSRY